MRALAKLVSLVGLAWLALTGCASVGSRPVSTAERLAAFPARDLSLERPATIRWNAQLVPFVEAQTDRDLFYALGLVHNHLRGAQIALLKRIARGRLSESAGPLAVDIDHALRILDFGRAADAIVARMPDETRLLMQAFVDGLNAAQESWTVPPPEFALLALKPEPYTLADVIAIGRLAGSDVNWLAYFALLPERGKPEFVALWRRTLAAGANAAEAFRAGPEQAVLNGIVAGFSKSGSNSVAVSPARSASGAAWIANDPHLGLNLPNLWLLAGVKSPGFHAVGMMVPGVPVIAVGRNPDMAWGGTNMRAASSDVVDVSGLPPALVERGETRIAVRFWFDSVRTVRRTPHGPIVTDSPAIPARPGDAIALRWIGHEPTDESTALLRAARARTPEEFRRAFDGFGVSAQNMVFADRRGNIGKVMAATLPAREGFPTDDPVLDPARATAAWSRLAGTLELPWSLNPAEGFVVSANDRPPPSKVPAGFYFSDDDRVGRLRQFLAARPRVGFDDLRDLQSDTVSPKAGEIARALVAAIERDAPDAGAPEFMARLRGWNGDYAADSAGAVAFETLLYRLVPLVYGLASAEEAGRVRGQWNAITTFLRRDLEALPAATRAAHLRAAVRAAARDAAKFPRWDDMHALRIQHVLGNLPVIGRAYVLQDLPVGGSRETPMKTAHNLVAGRHTATYGSQARHISDLSDPDANWFLLLGGQDGWLGSVHFADQVPMWQERRYLRLPLTDAAVRHEFAAATTPLAPRAAR